MSLYTHRLRVLPIHLARETVPSAYNADVLHVVGGHFQSNLSKPWVHLFANIHFDHSFSQGKCQYLHCMPNGSKFDN